MKKLAGWFLATVLGVAILNGAGCRNMYYAAYEKMGVYKRDLLKKRVVEARDEQKDAQQQFKYALTRLKEITRFEGGEAERAYRDLKAEYDDCVRQAGVVRGRIRDVEIVAQDLFREWEAEIGQINTPSLQSSSRQQLESTKRRYDELHAALVAAEHTMEPVLRQFNDYVLYLKHNLNAQAIASLKGEAANITTEINRLIEQMNRSIARADEFVKSLQ